MRKTASIDWSRYRAQFPITKRAIYFNHAAVSPLSVPVVNAMAEVIEGFFKEGILCEERVFARMDEVRGAIARLIGASKREIAFAKNTTQAVLMAAHGIHWKRGDNVVMPGIEFPANVYPWLSLEKKGVRVKMIAPVAGRITADMIERACRRERAP